MARRRKILAMTKSHLSQSERAKREYTESLITAGREDLAFRKVKKLLIDDIAGKEYKRIVKELAGFEIIGNLERTDLVVYANAYSQYMKACDAIAADDFRPVVMSKMGEKPNPWFNIRDLASKQMAASAKNLGLDPSSRMKLAAQKVKNEEVQLESAFGAI